MRNNGISLGLLFGACILLIGCYDSGKSYGIPGDVDLLITVEREHRWNPNSSFSVFATEYERKKTEEGDILVFRCPCFLGGAVGTGFFSPPRPLVTSTQIVALTELKMRLLPDAQYNIDIVEISK